MLQKLFIKNYALIDELEIDFSENLNMITGETGAGKSIILGALSLILGERANIAALKHQQAKCIVEGTFQIAAYQLQTFFEEEELDYEDITIIRREITPSGKSRAFVNDTPVHLTALKKLSEHLVNLHAQHQTLHLYDAGYQLFIIDTLAGHFDALTAYQNLYKTYRSNQRKLKGLQEEKAKLQKELDYILFQLNEFEEANLEDEREQEALEQEIAQLNNAENIQTSLQESVFLLEEQEGFAVLQQLNQVKTLLSNIAAYGSSFEQLSGRLDSVSIELQDVIAELNALTGEVVMDPERATEINERLNLFFRLQNKHGVRSLAELIAIRDDLQAQNQSAEGLDEAIVDLTQTLAKQKSDLVKMAQGISTGREKQFSVFEKRTNDMLARVGMPNAKVFIAHRVLEDEQLTIDGIDIIEILFAANKGSAPTELRKVASGGELSRLMLCIKSLIADNTALPTLIFDEIDTGISGEVALKVGTVMQELAQHHQVICITHLPQIAGKGSRHYFVYKQDVDEVTHTRIKVLSEEERILEIAKMLSGDKPGASAIANAKELLAV